MTFRPGESGNPGGRPRAISALRDLVQAKGPDLIERLMSLALADDTEPRVRVECIKVLLDRGYGRPAQPVDGDGEGGAIAHHHKVELVIVDPREGAAQ